MKTVRRPPYPKWNPGYFPCSSLTPLPLSSRRPSVSFGGFGVRLVEAPKDLRDLIGAFDLFVAPFLSQRFSSVNLLEAMALGKPVIATDVGEPQEIVENGVNGFLVPPRDERALADRILTLLTQPQELARMSARARDRGEQYSVDAYVRRLEGWYEELVAPSRRSEPIKVGGRLK